MSIVNPDNKKMLLSCDGGGIRGLIAVRCLEKLEKIEGKPCREIFHFMAGTSTGAIIVAKIAAPRTHPACAGSQHMVYSSRRRR